MEKTFNMSAFTNYSLEAAERLIADINGHNPEQEAKEIYEFSDGDNQFFNILIEKRVNDHIPVAYLTKHCTFRGLDLYIDERVLVPRTETEPLVEIAVEELPLGASVIDVGTGSGEVALAVKNERKDLVVAGSDISKDALDVASINSEALGIKVDWYEADLLKGIKQEFNAVLANLPYLPTTKRDSYEPEMVEHEPQVALWGGEDGYDLIRRLLQHTQARKGVDLVALEVGLGQHEDVCELVRSSGFATVFCTTDKKGDIRCVVGKR